MAITITDETTVKEALAMYIEARLPERNRQSANDILEKYVSKEEGYIGPVLDRKAKHKFAYVQIASMCLDNMILEHLANRASD